MLSSNQADYQADIAQVTMPWRLFVALSAGMVNLVGLVPARWSLLDTWASCAQYSDGCGHYMLLWPVWIAAWIAVLVGAATAFGVAVLIAVTGSLPLTPLTRRLGQALLIYLAVQASLTAVGMMFGAVLLIPSYLLGPPLAVLGATRPVESRSTAAFNA